jgi:hypothetical protein
MLCLHILPLPSPILPPTLHLLRKAHKMHRFTIDLNNPHISLFNFEHDHPLYYPDVHSPITRLLAYTSPPSRDALTRAVPAGDPFTSSYIMAAYLEVSQKCQTQQVETCEDENIVQEIVVTRRDAGNIVDLIRELGGPGGRKAVEEALDRLVEVDGVV